MKNGEKLIPTIINSCLQRKNIPIYGDGSNRRDWLYVADHCSAIDYIIRRGRLGETYNVGGNNELDNLSLAKKICQIMQQKKNERESFEGLIEFVTDRKGHDWRYAINNQKITNELGWEPIYQFEKALEITIDFYINSA